MKIRTQFLFSVAACALLSLNTLAAELEFDSGLPACRMPKAKTLPAKYYRYHWARKVKAGDSEVTGHGDSILPDPESGMRIYYTLRKADLNKDGICDWAVTLSIPVSTGGDRSTVNIFYFGVAAGWKRFGPEISGVDLPVDFGSGPVPDFDLFEEAGFLHEKSTNTTYIVGAFLSRHVNYYTKPGYRIFVWDGKDNKFRKLDKWKNATGLQVYKFFKSHGAFVAGGVSPAIEFDDRIEELEKD